MGSPKPSRSAAGHGARMGKRELAAAACPDRREDPDRGGVDVRAKEVCGAEPDLNGAHHAEPEGSCAGLVAACGRKPRREGPGEELHCRANEAENEGIVIVHRWNLPGTAGVGAMCPWAKPVPCQRILKIPADSYSTC